MNDSSSTPDSEKRANLAKGIAIRVGTIAVVLLVQTVLLFGGAGQLDWFWAWVAASSPKRSEKATYYSAVCVETGAVEAMVVLGNTNAATSVVFLEQLRAHHPEPLIVIWDNGPAHHGPEIREYLTTPGLHPRLVALPGHSPDLNPDEAIWDWIREDITANTCFGKATKVREHIDAFFAGLAPRIAEVKRRCRRQLQSLADALETSATCASSPCD